MIPSEMRAGAYLAPGQIAIQPRPVPVPGTGDILVRVHACGVCGSDVTLLHAQPTELAAGRIMGHEAVGTVAANGAGADFAVGDRVVVEPLLTCGTCSCCQAGWHSICPDLRILGVHTDGAFADFISVPARRLYRVPDDLDPHTASLTEPIAVAVHGLRLGEFRRGSRVLVLGAGMIGLATIAVARAWGAGEILISARYPHQAELARKLGATHVLSETESTFEALTRIGRGAPADMVVETIGGNSNTLTLVAAALAPRGTAVILGLSLSPVPVDPMPLLHKEARLQWANCYYTQESGQSDFHEALRLVAENRNSWAGMLTHRVPLAELGRAFALAADKKSGAVKVTVTMI